MTRAEREQVLFAGLSAAAEEIRGLRAHVAWQTRLLVLWTILAGRERLDAVAARDRAEIAEMELLERLVTTERAIDLAATRIVLAEGRLADALAALPELVAAVEGTSRPRCRRALEGLAVALRGSARKSPARRPTETTDAPT